MIARLYSRYGSSNWDHQPYPAGASLFEKLPSEILQKVLIFVTVPSKGTNRKVSMPENTNAKASSEHLNLLPVLLTSKKLYHTAIPLIYQNPILTSPSKFETFVERIVKDPSLGNFIRVLNLSKLAPTRNVTGPWSTRGKNPLYELISRTPLLRELYLDQYLGNEVDESVLRVILQLGFLQILEFNSCNSPVFADSLARYFDAGIEGGFISLVRLSLRSCGSISPPTFQHLLSLLPGLKSLDVSMTQITGDALDSIPPTARIEELDVSYCPDISGSDFASFIINHPAGRNLTTLRAAEFPEERTLSEENLSEILSSLTQLRNLNLKNTNLSFNHISILKKYASELESLSVGSQLQLRDLESLLLSPRYKYDQENVSAIHSDSESDSEDEPLPSVRKTSGVVLLPMEKAIQICLLRKRLNSITSREMPSKAQTKKPSLRYLDISCMSVSEQSKIQSSVLLGDVTPDLQVVELSPTVLNWSRNLPDVCRCVGWRFVRVGRRCWIERV